MFKYNIVLFLSFTQCNQVWHMCSEYQEPGHRTAFERGEEQALCVYEHAFQINGKRAPHIFHQNEPFKFKWIKMSTYFMSQIRRIAISNQWLLLSVCRLRFLHFRFTVIVIVRGCIVIRLCWCWFGDYVWPGRRKIPITCIMLLEIFASIFLILRSGCHGTFEFWRIGEITGTMPCIRTGIRRLDDFKHRLKRTNFHELTLQALFQACKSTNKSLISELIHRRRKNAHYAYSYLWNSSIHRLGIYFWPIIVDRRQWIVWAQNQSFP